MHACTWTQSCLTFCDPMDWSWPVSSVHGIFQARIPEWVVIPFSRGSYKPRNQTQVSWVSYTFFTSWATDFVNDIWWIRVTLNFFYSILQMLSDLEIRQILWVIYETKQSPICLSILKWHRNSILELIVFFSKILQIWASKCFWSVLTLYLF